jgi:hypothetical protein
MSQHHHHPKPPPLHPPDTARSALDMAETQKLPVFSPPGFAQNSHRRLPQPVLPPLQIPPDAVQPRLDQHFHSPINQLPAIHPGPLPRHQHHQPQQHLPRAAPVEKLLHYTPPRADPPYSPQQYGPSISPRSEFDNRGLRRQTEPRYLYEEARPIHHSHQHHEQPYASLTSPVEPSQQKAYAPLPSPNYRSPSYSYASSSTPFRGSVGSHSHSHRGSVAAPLGPLAYSELPTIGPPSRQEPRVRPLPGSIPQPVYNEKL